jgi:restriction endonuclease S subunit
MPENSRCPLITLSEVLVQDEGYITELEPRLYPKLSVKLYGRGVVPDEPTDGNTVKMKRHQLAKPGQVILSEIWAKKGAIGIVPEEGVGALVTSHFFLFDVDETKLLRPYMGWLLAANYFEPVLSGEARGTTGYAAVRPRQFLACRIPLPPLPEQRRIVARIEELAALIEEAQSLRAGAREEAEALIGSESAQLFRSVATSNPRLPIGETFAFRNDLIRPSDGQSGPLRFIGLQHIESHTGRRIGEDLLLAEQLEGRKFRFSPGEIVYGYLRPYLNKVWVADRDGVCSVDQYVIRPKAEMVDTKYLAHFVRSPIFLERAIELTHNLLLPRLRTALLESIPIPLPPLPEQRRIVAYLDDLQAQVDELTALQQATQAELDALLPSVLERAFRGEL